MTEIELLTAQLVHCTKSMLDASAKLNNLAFSLADKSIVKNVVQEVALQLYADRAERIDEDCEAVDIIRRAELFDQAERTVNGLQNRIQELEAAGGAYEAMKKRADERREIIDRLNTRITDLEDQLECTQDDLQYAYTEEDDHEKLLEAYDKLKDRHAELAKNFSALYARVSFLPAIDGGAGLRAENAGLKNRVAELTRELDTAHAMTAGEKEAKLQRECNEWSKENAALREELGRREDAHNYALQVVASQRDAHAKRADTFETAFRDLRAQLRSSLATAEQVEVYHGL